MAQTRTPHMTDYEAERRNFHLEVPEYFNFATDVIGKWASEPNKLAMLWIGQHGEEEHITFAHFFERSSRAANAFAKPGIKKGDRAYKDEDGYFWFVGRTDDVIISAGYRIGPLEVESALKEHPAVAESAVIASSDEMRGEIVKVYVIPAPGYAASPALATELHEHVKRVTTPYKYPREIEFVDALPKTISGKIRRVELREMERQKKQGKE